MCAAVYVDRRLRDRLLRRIYNDRARRVAPSYDYDIVIILQEAWLAWWLETAQHAAIAAVLAVFAVRAPAEAVIAASALAGCSVAWRLARCARSLPDYRLGRLPEPDARRLKIMIKLLGAGLLGAVLTLAAAMTWASGHHAGGAAWTARYGLQGAAVLLLAVSGVVAAGTTVRMLRLGRLRSHHPQRRSWVGRRLSVIDAQQFHPFTVRAGSAPFVGSGTSVLNWSFAQRLIRGKASGSEPDEEYLLPPFTTGELVDRLREKISELRYIEDAETRLPGLTVDDQVFVEGTLAGRYQDVLLAPAGSDPVRAAVTAAVSRPAGAARHYLACRVASWNGEVVTTVFVHVSLQGRTLYLEFATHALVPSRAEYQLIDRPRGTGAVATVRAVAAALLRLPSGLLAVTRLALAPVQLWAAVRPCQDRTVLTRSRLFADIGAEVSAREAASGDLRDSYFQVQDIVQHSKVIERRLIATVGDYLREHDVDTSEFLERTREILNTGVMISGSGPVTISGSAVGSKANVVNAAAPPPAAA